MSAVNADGEVRALPLRGTRITTVLIGVVLAVILDACAPSSAARATHHRPRGIVISRIDAVHFTSSRTGWALVTRASTGQHEIAKTTNGGHGWVVSRAIGAGISVQLHVVSADVVYVLLQSPSGGVTVLRTANGGNSWTTVSIHPNIFHPNLMGSFAARASWLLFCAPPDLSGTACELLRSTDARQEWRHISSFPVAGLIPNGLTFMGNRGWITGQNHSDNAAEVLSTRDGGRTWSPMSLMIPSGAATNGDTYPVDLQGKTAVLPAVLYESKGAGFLLYEAMDGVFRPTAPLSTTASPDAPSASAARRGMLYSVANRVVTYVLAAPFLYRTANGGQAWDVVNDHAPAWTVMDFVTRAVGYAAKSGAQGTPPGFWATTDGGVNWMRIPYEVTEPSRT